MYVLNSLLVAWCDEEEFWVFKCFPDQMLSRTHAGQKSRDGLDVRPSEDVRQRVDHRQTQRVHTDPPLACNRGAKRASHDGGQLTGGASHDGGQLTGGASHDGGQLTGGERHMTAVS